MALPCRERQRIRITNRAARSRAGKPSLKTERDSRPSSAPGFAQA
jgi:hypothetical protein